ncbi:hypothetical protein Aca07nite_09540 [Actinoplanes capillaceus]|uniref:Uncharacterized protein n=2 Tax=Actinoplanes campanulatus TaxID=113559 RepID=A0ABQ3W9E9_9ACTN|nr:hypothetical protein Aca07nite_09540 [Actinoplanes capillaceus]
MPGMTDQLRVGDVAVTPLPGGGYGACQISEITGEHVTLHALDWSGPRPPEPAELQDAGLVLLDHHSWSDRIAQISVFPQNHPMPPDLEWIGNLPVPPGVPAGGTSFSGWQSPVGDMVRQRRWERLPEPVRAAYRALRPPEPVTADLGGGPVTLATSLGHLDLRSGDIPLPASGPVDWSVLDRLPRCTEITWSGPDRGLTAALARHPLVSGVNWFDAPPLVDLGDTSVLSLRAAGDELREIRLPDGAHHLNLGPTGSRCTVRAADRGRWLRLALFLVTPSTLVPAGLDGVRQVSLTGAGVLSAATVAGLHEMHTLRLQWTGPPGRLDDLAALAGLPGLRLLEMVDAYGVDADLPAHLPGLRHLDIHGLRGSVAKELRARLRRTEVGLSLAGAKSDRWLAANMDNPFRDWADDDPKAGAAACKAFAAALRAVDRLPATRTPADAEPILRTLVEAINLIDEKWGIVDTLRREEAGDAFVTLAARAGVPTPTADDWFDKWRDF